MLWKQSSCMTMSSMFDSVISFVSVDEAHMDNYFAGGLGQLLLAKNLMPSCLKVAQISVLGNGSLSA